MALVKKQDFEAKQRIAKRKKIKTSKWRTTLDIVPLKKFTEENYVHFKDNTYCEMYEINTVALDDISQSENISLMSNLAYFLRVYDDSIKILSTSFNTDTMKQIKYWQETLEIAEQEEEDESRINTINEKIIILKHIAKVQVNKEHILFIYAKTKEELEELKRKVLSESGNLIYHSPMTTEQKSYVFSDLNNPKIF
ncbi:hypothetical protein NGC89_02500 [Staphylococcus xylosus]|uniref:hypothetical protein n=1 Tax=Staphylococcus xylosus TaxID=1288 RepID=UPI002DB59F15|nr:hypothetical protein [Staphylococcus xylosus]MEB7800336.1 hypothetical protein [Staphylococcus xylosus]